MRFDPKLIEALQKLGFAVAEDGTYAESHPTVDIEPRVDGELKLTILLANGAEIVTKIPAQLLISKARDEDS
jgi:hypothetical protein